MYENKMLINLYVLTLGKNFEIYVPINEKIGNIIKLLKNNMLDSIDFSRTSIIMDAENGKCYNNNEIIRETTIKNGTRLVLI